MKVRQRLPRGQTSRPRHGSPARSWSLPAGQPATAGTTGSWTASVMGIAMALQYSHLLLYSALSVKVC